MANGGGGHPYHLPITTLPSHNSSNAKSLQTPDTSSLFDSPVGGRICGGGNLGGTGSNFSIPTQDPAHSFSSLEELLDVTGINSMGLGHSDTDTAKELEGDCHGVNSLQQLAREVEKSCASQGTLFDDSNHFQKQQWIPFYKCEIVV